MATHITARPLGATEDVTLKVRDLAPEVLTLVVFESLTRKLRPGEPIKFSATLDDQPIVTRSATPLYDSCRVLQAFGFSGKVQFVKPDGTPAMSMDIDRGAQRTVVEANHGPRVIKYVPGEASEAVTSGRNADVLIIGKVEA